MPRALSQRAARSRHGQPQRRLQCARSLRPAFSASSRHRCSSFSNALSSTASFFNGWRSTLGTIPATSQLDRLISMTAISVPFGSRAVRDRLRSFNFCRGAPSVHISDDGMQYPRRRPIASSVMGFETGWNDLSGGLVVSVTTGPSGSTISPHPPSARDIIPPLGGARFSFLLDLILHGFHASAAACSRSSGTRCRQPICGA